ARAIDNRSWRSHRSRRFFTLAQREQQGGNDVRVVESVVVVATVAAIVEVGANAGFKTHANVLTHVALHTRAELDRQVGARVDLRGVRIREGIELVTMFLVSDTTHQVRSPIAAFLVEVI